MWKIPSGECKTFQGPSCQATSGKILPDGETLKDLHAVYVFFSCTVLYMFVFIQVREQLWDMRMEVYVFGT